MKKFLVLAMMATLLMAGSMFASQRHFSATPNATFANGLLPTTTNNDDTCDISVAPAATLLLPYFEVDTTRSGGENTLFTVTNTSAYPQIAHVVVWTDWSYPVLDFNLFLTGYDVQGISLYDVIVRGLIPSTSNATSVSHRGSMSVNNSTGNPNLLTANGGSVAACGNLPGQLTSDVYHAVTTALTSGSGVAYGCKSTQPVGGNHGGLAIGYVTVDVANNCSTSLPGVTAGYFETEILFDNVLIGDYEQLGPVPQAFATTTGFDGPGNPMVHIRAVPEGGPAAVVQTNLPYTFYDRYTSANAPRADRRQPLPATFAARYIQANANVSTAPSPSYATNFKIWREGYDISTCTTASDNSEIDVSEFVRFDEAENPFIAPGGSVCSPLCGTSGPTLPEASLTASTDSIYPPLPSDSTATGGWMYMNLNNGGGDYHAVNPNVDPDGYAVALDLPIATDPRPSQNWVVIEMFATIGSNRMAAEFDAAWLRNGCSEPAPNSGATDTVPGNIGPNYSWLACPPGGPCVGGENSSVNETPFFWDLP